MSHTWIVHHVGLNPTETAMGVAMYCKLFHIFTVQLMNFGTCQARAHRAWMIQGLPLQGGNLN